MKQQTHHHKQSFTLIELLIVIAIIAILAAVIVANVTSAQAQARDVRRTQDLDQLKTALEMYYLDHGSYPHGYIGSHSDDGFCIEKATDAGDFQDILIDGDYISSIPRDPLYNSSQCFDAYNAECHCYLYKTDTNQKYKLFAKTEQQDFKPATQDGGKYDTRYEAYAQTQGSNQISFPDWYTGWYEGSPYLNGIVGAWSFGESSGTTAHDTSGNHNNGTLKNGPTWVGGKFGNALSFDGVDDYVEVLHSASLGTPTANNRLSWGAWVKGLGSWSGSHEMVLKKEGICYISIMTKEPFASLRIDGAQVTVDSNFPIQIGTWNYVMATWDGTTLAIYVNGDLKNSTTHLGQLNLGTNNLLLGKYTPTDTTYQFNGLIDEVRIYNRALSAEEIAADYAAGGN